MVLTDVLVKWYCGAFATHKNGYRLAAVNLSTGEGMILGCYQLNVVSLLKCYGPERVTSGVVAVRKGIVNIS